MQNETPEPTQMTTKEKLAEAISNVRTIAEGQIVIAYRLGQITGEEGKPKAMMFNKLAPDELYKKVVDFDFLRKSTEALERELKKIVAIENIQRVREKRKKKLTVPNDNSQTKIPAIVTDQFYDFINDPSLNLGLANFHLFACLPEADKLMHFNGSRLSDVSRITANNADLAQTIRDNGGHLPEGFTFKNEDFDLRAILKPVMDKRLMRKSDVCKLMAIIERVNNLSGSGRVKTNSAMEKHFGKGTNSVTKVHGKEIGTKIDVEKLLPLATEVNNLFNEQERIRKHSEYSTPEEMEKCRQQLGAVAKEYKVKNEELRQQLIKMIGYASSAPAKLIINMSKKNLSLFDYIKGLPTSNGKPAFVYKEDAVDGEYGYTHNSRMTFVSHLTVSPDLVKAEDASLVRTVDEESLAQIKRLDDTLTQLLNAYKKLSEKTPKAKTK